MNDFIGIIILILIILIFIPISTYFTRKMKEEAENSCSELREILNAKKWKIRGYRQKHLYTVGTFKMRKVRCCYKNTIIGTFIDLGSKPTIVPKKVPWFKPISIHPSIYKNYSLYYGTVSGRRFIDKTQKLSKEECLAMLEDLDRACKIVESGNYDI